MTEINELLRQYVNDQTPDEVPPFEGLLAGNTSRSSRRFPTFGRSALLLAATTTIVALAVVGFSVIRQGILDEQAPNPIAHAPASGIEVALLGTWQLVRMDGNAYQGANRNLQRAVLITFKADGAVEGFDGCNVGRGVYEVTADGSFNATYQASTDTACFPHLDVPAPGATQVSVADNRATFTDASDNEVAEYDRPGGAFAPVAKLITNPQSGELLLSLTSYGSGSCPYRIRHIYIEAPNELMIRMMHSRGLCTADLRAHTDTQRVPDWLSLDFQQPITGTLIGVYPIRVTVPLNTDELDISDEPTCTKPVLGASPSQQELAELTFDSAKVCRWTNPDMFYQGGESTLTDDVGLESGDIENVLDALVSAEQRHPECSMIDSLPPVEYTVVLQDDQGSSWVIEVPEEACLGFRLNGVSYSSSELTSLLGTLVGESS